MVSLLNHLVLLVILFFRIQIYGPSFAWVCSLLSLQIWRHSAFSLSNKYETCPILWTREIAKWVILYHKWTANDVIIVKVNIAHTQILQLCFVITTRLKEFQEKITSIRWNAEASYSMSIRFNPLSANPTKWSNTLKQFVGNLPTNCLSVFDHFVKLALKGLKELRMWCHMLV